MIGLDLLGISRRSSMGLRGPTPRAVIAPASTTLRAQSSTTSPSASVARPASKPPTSTRAPHAPPANAASNTVRVDAAKSKLAHAARTALSSANRLKANAAARSKSGGKATRKVAARAQRIAERVTQSAKKLLTLSSRSIKPRMKAVSVSPRVHGDVYVGDDLTDAQAQLDQAQQDAADAQATAQQITDDLTAARQAFDEANSNAPDQNSGDYARWSAAVDQANTDYLAAMDAATALIFNDTSLADTQAALNAAAELVASLQNAPPPSPTDAVPPPVPGSLPSAPPPTPSGGGSSFGEGSGTSGGFSGGGFGGGFATSDGYDDGTAELEAAADAESAGGQTYEFAYASSITPDEGASVDFSDAAENTEFPSNVDDPEASAQAEADQFENAVVGQIATLAAPVQPKTKADQAAALNAASFRPGDRVTLDGQYGTVIPSPAAQFFGPTPLTAVWVRWDDDYWHTDRKECVEAAQLTKVPHLPSFGGGVDLSGDQRTKRSAMRGLDVFCGTQAEFDRGFENGLAVARGRAKPLSDLKLGETGGDLERGYAAGMKAASAVSSMPAGVSQQAAASTSSAMADVYSKVAQALATGSTPVKAAEPPRGQETPPYVVYGLAAVVLGGGVVLLLRRR